MNGFNNNETGGDCLNDLSSVESLDQKPCLKISPVNMF